MVQSEIADSPIDMPSKVKARNFKRNSNTHLTTKEIKSTLITCGRMQVQEGQFDASMWRNLDCDKAPEKARQAGLSPDEIKSLTFLTKR